MKQFLKKTFPILFLLLMLAPTAFASKMSFEWTLKKLNRLQGIWYSIEDPSQTVSFDGGKFEGNQVVSFDDVAGLSDCSHPVRLAAGHTVSVHKLTD